jgi:hypothetical protein
MDRAPTEPSRFKKARVHKCDEENHKRQFTKSTSASITIANTISPEDDRRAGRSPGSGSWS